MRGWARSKFLIQRPVDSQLPFLRESVFHLYFSSKFALSWFALTPGVSASSTPLGLKPIDSHPGSNKSAKAEKNIFSMFFIGPRFFSIY